MTPSTCCFCTHLNPARAKFCNECASPMHLKPCRLCDAVNARDAQACYRCEAALPEAPRTTEPSPERIVAEADETLAELKRELIASPAPDADVAQGAVGSLASEMPADASAAFDLRAREPMTSTGEGSGGDRIPLAVGTTDEQPAPADRCRAAGRAASIPRARRGNRSRASIAASLGRLTPGVLPWTKCASRRCRNRSVADLRYDVGGRGSGGPPVAAGKAPASRCARHPRRVGRAARLPFT